MFQRDEGDKLVAPRRGRAIFVGEGSGAINVKHNKKVQMLHVRRGKKLRTQIKFIR